MTNATIEGCSRVDFDSTTATPLAVFGMPPGRGRERSLVIRQALAERTSVESLEIGALESDADRLREAGAAISGRDAKDASAPVVARLPQTHEGLRKMEAKKRTLEKELEARTEALREVLSGLNALRPKIIEERRQAEAGGKSQVCPETRHAPHAIPRHE